METWNQRLAKALAESDYTANRLAGEIGVSAPTLAAWVGAANIKPAQDIRADHLFKVCERLKVRPEWVLYRRPPRSSEGGAEGELSASGHASEARVYDDTTRAVQPVKGLYAAPTKETKQEIMRAVADGDLSDELLTAIAWMIRAGTRAPVRGDQHHTRTVKLNDARRATRKATGTG